MKVCTTPTFKPDQMIYIEKPPLSAFSVANAKRLAMIIYKKLMRKVARPFTIICFQPNTVTINEHGRHNAVSIDRTSFPPGNETLTNTS